jgi:mannose-6-phosphate isomerase-like protein (cupin superfamily)
MKNAEEYIKTDILEMYVLGLTSEEQNKEIAEIADFNTEIRNEIEAITNALIKHAEAGAPAIDPTIKPMFMATMDYTKRLEAGEEVTHPAILNENSKVADYASWLNRTDMVAPADYDNIFLKIIGYDATATTAITWIKEGTPYETHKNEIEKFLIVEGSCDIVTDAKVYSLVAGDYLSIPLHVRHEVKITSKIPCKIVLQRVAA